MIYVGTLHLDLKGIERLRKIISRLRMRTRKELVITLENPSDETPESARERIERVRLNRIGTASAIKDEALNYLETRIAENYAYETLTLLEERRVKPIFVDTPEIRKLTLSYAPFERTVLPKEELFARYNETIDKLYYGKTSHEDIFRLTGKRTVVDASPDFWREREKYMAEKIKETKPDVHIGGLNHSHGFKDCFKIKCLWDLLHEDGDTRMRLCDA